MKLGLNIMTVLVALTGLVWFFQGIGVIQGSFMTADPKWAFIGIVCIGIGGGMLFYNNRRRRVQS